MLLLTRCLFVRGSRNDGNIFLPETNGIVDAFQGEIFLCHYQRIGTIICQGKVIIIQWTVSSRDFHHAAIVVAASVRRDECPVAANGFFEPLALPDFGIRL
jgi:hypothetical protein